MGRVELRPWVEGIVTGAGAEGEQPLAWGRGAEAN